MKHDEQNMHELLCAYVLGEVSDDERAKVEVALADDAELREERARLEATIGLVQGVMGEPEELSPAATSELLEKAGMKQPTLWSFQGLRVAAALVVLIGGAMVFIPREQPSVGTGGFADQEGAHGLIAKNVAPEERASRTLLKEAVGEHNEVVGKGSSSGRARMGGRQGGAKLDDLRAEADSFAKNESASQEPADLKDRLDAAEVELISDLGYAGGSESGGKPASTPPGQPSQEGAELGEAAEIFRRSVSDLDQLGYAGDDGQDSPAAKFAAEPEPSLLDLNAFGGGAEAEKVVSPAEYKGPGDTKPPGETVAGPSGPSGPSATPAKQIAPGTGAPSGSAGGPVVRGQSTSDLDKNYFVPLKVMRRAAPSAPVTGSPSVSGGARTVAHESPGDAGFFTGEGKPSRKKAGVEMDSFELPPYEGMSREEADAYAGRIISRCRPHPGETPGRMFFRYWGDNAFEYPMSDPLSTFSIDVDTASYSLAREYLRRGALPPKAAVRTEEFVNYFKADVPAPEEGDFAIYTELAPSLFGDGTPESAMLRVVVRGREVSKQERAPLALTFVVDTSGSMASENRMELVKHALRLLVAELDANDSIALVAFSSEARLVLPMVSIANRSSIETAINALQAEGSTNAEAGLKLGYAQAVDALRGDGGNRVVFLSDGVANVGVTDQERIAEDVRKQRERGIYLNTIGVGMGNHNDNFLEQLANKGDGLCNYVNDAAEAKRAIVDNFTGAFETIAKDVKVQVEFDPKQVESYRLLGYENRAIADKDFRNNAVDAGEVGAGHQVTALYELIRIAGREDFETPMATVRLRWKKPSVPDVELGLRASEPVVTEIAHEVQSVDAASAFLSTSTSYRRSVLVAQFAEFLRRSRHARTDSLNDLMIESKSLALELQDAEFDEFVALLSRSAEQIRSTLVSPNELAMTVDALRENHILRARYDALVELESNREAPDDSDLLERIEAQNRELEERIRELVRGEGR